MQLCTLALDAEDERETRNLLMELRRLLHERIEDLRTGLAIVHGASSRNLGNGSSNQ